MTSRMRIPSVEVEVLRKSGRRCCICSGLYGDNEVKRGQIAHLDRDPTNNKIDNLAFLCLQHHDQYDSRTSQSKGWTIKEVKIYREQLYDTIKNLRGSSPQKLLQQNSPPIISSIRRTAIFRTRFDIQSDQERIFDEITTGVLDYGPVCLSFDVTNPNQLDMRVMGFRIELVEYSEVEFFDVRKWAQGGGQRYQELSCLIEPRVGTYECVLQSGEFDYIKLSFGELDVFRIAVEAKKEGFYALKIQLHYSIGGETNKIEVSREAQEVGFIARSTCDALYARKAA